jgi:excisionase family DNA binding protein
MPKVKERFATPQPPSVRAALSPGELASTLGMSESAILRAVKLGEIKSSRIGRRILIPVSEIDHLLKVS